MHLNTRALLGALAAAGWLAFAPPASAAGAAPWDGPAFSWDAHAALVALKDLPEREPASVESETAHVSPPGTDADATSASEDASSASGVDLLLDDETGVFDADGRETNTRHLVYWVRTARAAVASGAVLAAWRPFFQYPPTIRGRVITPDGAVHTLDPATFTTAEAGGHKGVRSVDVKVVGGPLPAMNAGVLVETETVLEDGSPLFGAGTVEQWRFGSGPSSARHLRVHVESPASVPMRFATTGAGLTVAMHLSPAGQTFDIDTGPLPALPAPEPFLPPEVSLDHTLSVSTGRDWSSVASAYARIIDRQVSASPIASVVQRWRGGAEGRDAIVRSLLANIRRSVRPLAVVLGAHALVPATPDETLIRGYGDTNDLSTLLVAALREAGITAHVALVKSGPGRDVDAQLPGIGGFDRAIVYVPGSPDLWIDPAELEVPVGELPAQEQGRQALIASTETAALVQTPRADAHANRTLITQEIYLQNEGQARNVVTIEYHGAAAAALRRLYRGIDPKSVLDHVAADMQRLSGAERLKDLELSPPDAIDQPFRIRFEALNTSYSGTGDVLADAWVSPVQLVNDLLPLLWSPPSPGAAQHPRRNDFLFPTANEAELKFRIIPPPSYAARPLQADAVPSLAPLHFTRTMETAPSGEVLVEYHFEAPYQRLTPAQYEAVRQGALALSNSAFKVVFDSIPEQLAKEGRVREATSLYQGLAATHPTEAIFQSRLAAAWLKAGAGRAAREAAREAVRIDPGSARAQDTLAWVLSCDLTSAAFRPGFDRAGAIEASREAIRLAPGEESYWIRLLGLLERNENGDFYGHGTPTEEVAATYEKMRTAFHSIKYDRNYLAVLLRLGRYQAMLDLAPPGKRDAISLFNRLKLGIFKATQDLRRTREETDEKTEMLLIAARAAMSGAEAALAEARRFRLDPEKQRVLLSGATASLIIAREYTAARGLLDAARDLPGKPEAALEPLSHIADRIQRAETQSFTNQSPTDVVRLCAHYTFDRTTPDDRFAAILSPELLEAYGRAQLVRLVRDRPSRGTTPAIFGEILLSEDLALANLDLQVEGDDAAGYRVTARAIVDSGPTKKTAWYVVKSGAGYLLAASNGSLNMVGFQAARFAADGRPEDARRWLDWALDSTQGQADASFRAVWSRTGGRTLTDIKLAAAVLMREGRLHKEAISILEALLPQVEDKQKARALTLALIKANLTEKRYQQALDGVIALPPTGENADEIFDDRERALRSLNRYQDARELAATRLQNHPDDEKAIDAMLRTARKAGDWDGVAKWGKEKAEQSADPKDVADGYNALAWISVARSQSTPEAIEAAERAADLTKHNSPPILNTLAAVHAEANHPSDALKALWHAADLKSGQMDPGDWFPLGRLYEQYGLFDDAIAAYGKVLDGTSLDWQSSPETIASKRIENLKRVRASAKE